MAMITNIQHFMDHNHNVELPPKAAKIRDYLGQIIRVSTATPNEVNIASALRCQKRVNRKRCEGTILIHREDVPSPFIFWVCSNCRDDGRIEGYIGTYYDLSRTPSHLGSESGDKLLNVQLSLEEYEAWISGDFIPYDFDSQRLVYSARFFEEVVDLDAYESDLDVLRDCIAADANHEKFKKRARLMDSVFIKVSDVLDTALELAPGPSYLN